MPSVDFEAISTVAIARLKARIAELEAGVGSSSEEVETLQSQVAALQVQVDGAARDNRTWLVFYAEQLAPGANDVMLGMAGAPVPMAVPVSRCAVLGMRARVRAFLGASGTRGVVFQARTNNGLSPPTTGADVTDVSITFPANDPVTSQRGTGVGTPEDIDSGDNIGVRVTTDASFGGAADVCVMLELRLLEEEV